MNNLLNSFICLTAIQQITYFMRFYLIILGLINGLLILVSQQSLTKTNLVDNLYDLLYVKVVGR